METLSLETAVRLIVIGQQLLIAAVFLAGSDGRAARVSGAFFMLSVVAYMYTSDDALAGTLPMLDPVIALLSMVVPYLLWLFARAVFEGQWPRAPWIYAAVLAGLPAWIIHVGQVPVDSTIKNGAEIVFRVAELSIVAHALWIAVNGRPDDLLERRRAFRLFFVGIIALQAAAVIVVELVFTGATPPAWLTLLNVLVIAAMTIGLAIPMLRLSGQFFEPATSPEVSDDAPAPEHPGTTEDIYRDKLLQLMDDGYYQETGLTISMLANRLNYPEHQLRRLINGRLGYRNFSAFLNDYRIDDAKAALADPDQARTPVLTIALTLGYASLGPFNRAFKASTDMTPTEYRRRNLGRLSADSE